MGRRLNIFNPRGSVSRALLDTHEKNKIQSFITITSVGKSGILLGSAPVTGVQISQLTDFSVTKSLDMDFLVATFGDTPTRIQISGLSFFNLNGCNLGNTRADNQQIMNFYKENKLSNRNSNRVDISIASGVGEPPVAFRCVIVGLETKNQASDGGVSNIAYSYTMTLIGVDKQSGGAR